MAVHGILYIDSSLDSIKTSPRGHKSSPRDLELEISVKKTLKKSWSVDSDLNHLRKSDLEEILPCVKL